MVVWVLQCGFFTVLLEKWSPIFLSPWTGFLEDSFSMEQGSGGGIVLGWFKCITFIMPFMLLLLHQALDPRGQGHLLHRISEYSGRKGWRRIPRVTAVLHCFVLGTSCVFNFLLAFCTESFNETVLESWNLWEAPACWLKYIFYSVWLVWECLLSGAPFQWMIVYNWNVLHNGYCNSKLSH